MHSIRVDDDLWQCALTKARTEDRTITEVITTGLRGYIGIAPPVRIERPAAATGQCPPHPKARVIKGLCGACGTHTGEAS
jgi:hypothetical protein